MDVGLQQLAARQLDLVAYWQLIEAGWSRWMIAHHAHQQRWRAVHRGVYAMTQSRLTREQRWMAATLTTPDSFLSFGSAGARYGICRWEKPYEVVTRPGNGGPRRLGPLLIYRSLTLTEDMGTIDGMRITSPERTVIDLASQSDDRRARRLLREALRLELTNPLRMVAAATRHGCRRNAPLIARTASHYATLPYDRTRSDPEALALEILHDAGIPQPRVNHKIAGEEADLSWPGLIIELDGPQFHRFKAEDARKQRVWEAAGYVVRRMPTDDVYEDPARLVALYSSMRPSA
jgi:Protein of unknown function (DUF559)